MRFKLGAIPKSDDFVPDESWKPLREPSPSITQLIVLPLGGVCFVLFVVLWLRLTDLNTEQLNSDAFVFTGLLLFIPLTAVHELIHALFHPQYGKSDRSIIGFWPAPLMFYAHYNGKLTHNRFLTILAMPMIVLTILQLLVALMTGHANGDVEGVSTWNSLFACVDMFGISLLCFQMPHNAICHNQDWKTYWRLGSK